MAGKSDHNSQMNKEVREARNLLVELSKDWSQKRAKAFSDKIARLRKKYPQLVEKGYIAALLTEHEIVLRRQLPSRPKVVHLRNQKKKKPLKLIDRKRLRRN